jgi:hypothetical protein
MTPCVVQGCERLRECEAECRRVEGELAVSQLAGEQAAATAATAAAQLAAEQEAGAVRESGGARELHTTREALVREGGVRGAVFVPSE